MKEKPHKRQYAKPDIDIYTNTGSISSFFYLEPPKIYRFSINIKSAEEQLHGHFPWAHRQGRKSSSRGCDTCQAIKRFGRIPWLGNLPTIVRLGPIAINMMLKETTLSTRQTNRNHTKPRQQCKITQKTKTPRSLRTTIIQIMKNIWNQSGQPSLTSLLLSLTKRHRTCAADGRRDHLFAGSISGGGTGAFFAWHCGASFFFFLIKPFVDLWCLDMFYMDFKIIIISFLACCSGWIRW